MNKRGGNGFTLVELLVVMAIMSILAIISFGQFQGAQAKARDVERKSNISTIFKALGYYFSDYNDLPDTATFNDLLVSGMEFSDKNDHHGNYVYLAKTPTEKSASMPQYCFLKINKSYVVMSGMENLNDTDCHKFVLNDTVLNQVGVGAANRTANCSSTMPYHFALSSPDINFLTIYQTKTGNDTSCN